MTCSSFLDALGTAFKSAKLFQSLIGSKFLIDSFIRGQFKNLKQNYNLLA